MEPTSIDLEPQALERAAARLRRQRWPEREGQRHGIAWALEVASYDDIQWLLGLRDRGEGLVERIEQEREGFTEDWADDFQGLDETKAWRGFADSVAQVWNAVRDQVEAE